MATQVGVCNMALIELGSEPLTALDDQSRASRAFNANWATAMAEVLELRPWGFARKRAQLSASQTAPTFGPAAAYTLPADFRRFLADPDNPDQDYRLEGGVIVSDDGAPLDVTYIADTDIGQWSATAARLLALKLAWHCAYAITGDKGVRDEMYSLFEKALSQVSANDAFNQRTEALDGDVWLRSRHWA